MIPIIYNLIISNHILLQTKTLCSSGQAIISMSSDIAALTQWLGLKCINDIYVVFVV